MRKQSRIELSFLKLWIVLISGLIASSTIGIEKASAQSTSLIVLIDGNYSSSGQQFLETLKSSLAPEDRDTISFEAKIVPQSDMSHELRESKWDLAIMSSADLVSISSRTAASAFEIPFLFTTTQSAIDVQESPAGQASLALLADNMRGLVYLNAGMTLVAGRNPVTSSEALKGLKVGVASPAQFQTLQMVGSAPVTVSPGSVHDQLRTGKIDSALINSDNQSSWQLSDHRFLLANSIKAQVAVVATRNESWDRLPFVLRAIIGDAAIKASVRLNRTLLETERALFGQADNARVTVVKFRDEDVARAASQWINAQPEATRELYSGALSQLLQREPSPQRAPNAPRRGGQAGQLFFATTREETRKTSLALHFGDDRTDVIKCGRIKYSNTDTANAAFDGPIDTGNPKCGAEMNEILRSSKHLLIFIHGFNNRFSDAVDRGIILKNALGNDTSVLIWSWPSKRDGIVGQYDYDKESVGGISRQIFLEFLKDLKDGSMAGSLNILAHSMGSWHLIGALTGLSSDPGRPKLDNVAMAAPDVPVDEFKFGLPRMHIISKRLSLYACGSDHALQMSKRMNDYPRAGTGGPQSIIVNNQLDSIDVEGRWLSTNHSYVFEAEKVLNDLSSLIGADADAASRGLMKKPNQVWYYWVFP